MQTDYSHDIPSYSQPQGLASSLRHLWGLHHLYQQYLLCEFYFVHISV